MKRHLLIAFTLVVLVVLGVLARNAATVRLMVQNARALQEGAAQAERLVDPDAVLTYVLEHPRSVQVLVIEEQDTLAQWGRRASMPLAGGRLPALAHAHQAALPDTVLLRESVAAYVLPEDLAEVAAAPCRTAQPCTWSEVVERVAGGDRRAYTDLLLGTVPTAPGIPAVPHLGYLLVWNNHTLNTPVADRIAAFQAMARADIDSLARDIAQAYRADEEGFRRREIAWREAGGQALSLREQSDLATATFPQATAAELASWLEMTPEAETALYSDAFPGLMLAAGVRTLVDGRRRRVVVLMQQVPLAVLYHLGRTRLDRGLVLDLLHNDQAVERLASASGVEAKSSLTAPSTR